MLPQPAAQVTLSIQPAIIVQGTSDGTATNPTAANTAFATVDSAPVDATAYVKFAGAASTKLTVRSAFNKRAIYACVGSAPRSTPFTGVATLRGLFMIRDTSASLCATGAVRISCQARISTVGTACTVQPSWIPSWARRSAERNRSLSRNAGAQSLTKGEAPAA